MKLFRIGLAALFVAACFAGPASTEAAIPLGFRIFGGGVYLPGGDINATRAGFEMDGHMSRIRFGADLGAEVVWPVWPSGGLTLGLGYIQASRLSRLESMGSVDSLDTSARAIPVTIGAYYTFASWGPVELSIRGDVGYYFAHYKETWAWSFGWMPPPNESNEFREANAGGIGLQGRVAVAYHLSPSIALVGEVFSRWADIKGFEGTQVSTYYSGDRYETKGTLYYYDWESGGQYWPWIEILDKPPHEEWSSGVKNDREATISFSGFGARLGVSIRL